VDVADFEALPGQVLGTSNPATLRCNDIVVGASSHDVLKHLSAAELAVNTAAGADRMARLAAHLPAQASYYPLYPAPLGAALDTSQGERLRMAVTPHLLLLPSDLSPFAKVVPLAVPPPEAPVAAAAADPGTPGTPRTPDAPDEPMQAEASSPEAATAAAATKLNPGSVLCVNPGRLTKGTSAGTFVHVHIHPATTDGAELAERTRIEVLRV
jgi:DNA polymerase alpha subunit B